MSGNANRSRRRKGAGTSKSSSSKPSAAEPVDAGHVCLVADCGKVCKSASGLASHQRAAHPVPVEPVKPESPSQAVERVLAGLELTDAQAVLAATVRQLAVALEYCEVTDKAKTSKELTARMDDLLAAQPVDGGSDWTDDDD